MAFAFLLILAATTFVGYVVISRALDSGEDIDPFAGRPGTTATITTTANPGSESSGSTSSTLASTLVRPTSVAASSALQATSTNSYRATNLVDGDLATAWNEGVEGPGEGEWVRFDFSQELVLARIEIANGYQKDDDRFLGNPRVKSMKLEYSNGSVQLVDLLDAEDLQTVIPIRQEVEWVKFVIVSVYPGYEWEDTALSEVRIYTSSD